VSFADHPLAHRLAPAAHALGQLAIAPLRGLLVRAAASQLAEQAFTLHLALEDAQRRIDVVVADEYLHLVYRLPRLSPTSPASRGAWEQSPSPCSSRGA